MTIPYAEFNTTMEAVRRHFNDGMVELEQRMLRSRKNKACIECDAPGTARQESVLIKSVSHYWFCEDCDTYWKNHD